MNVLTVQVPYYYGIMNWKEMLIVVHDSTVIRRLLHI